MKNKIKKEITNKTSKVITISLIFSSIFSFFPLGTINNASAALVPGGAVGPIVPSGLSKGFPAWYMDQNGLAVELMEAADGFGISDPVDPTNNFSQELGFNAEGFYWAADAIPANVVNSISGEPISGGLILALEAAFAGEAAVDGEQSVFGRIRYRVDGLIIGETYTVNHPFGTETAIATDSDGNGPKLVGDINVSSDIGCFATAGVLSCDPNNPPGNSNNFGLALQSGIGPFLTWDTFDLNPALTDPALINPANPTKRYLGNPNVEHAIKGGPNGNTFSVTGPGITSFETNLFTVVGRIAVIDTTAPTVVSVTPASVLLGSENVVLSTNITDNLGVRTVTADLGSLGNSLSATLNGAQEVPATASGGTGSGNFTIDTAANTLSFNITVSGLQGGSETAAHIHGPALAGANAPAVFNLPQGASKVGTWNYPENLEADILAGRMYVQIHTALFSAGEVRGQILPTSNVQNLILTAGTRTNGTWGVLIPSVTRPGLFTIPITATDGSNSVTANHSLAVQVLTSISVAPAVATAVVGTNQQFTAQGLDQFGNPMDPQPAIVWTSSNNGVASINTAGLASGVAVGGPVTITASAGAISGSASLTVINPPSVFTSISMAPAASTIQVAATQQLTAQALDQFGVAMNPQPAITWNSSSNAVATVSSTGLVTGVSLGSAVITATSGTTAATANITVSSAPACQTGADTNADGFISNIEILNYVRGWKAGTVSNLLILRAINFWKSGTGC